MPRIWGARSLAPIYPAKTNLPEPIGEAWLTGPLSQIPAGPLQGSLTEAWRNMPPEWRGTDLLSPLEFHDFPLLVKFLFPTDQLSIQVHPRDAYARQNESPHARGKTEMWHVVSAQPGANLLLGLVPDANQKQFLNGLENRSLQNLFQRWPVHAGDTFYVPAGTAHTIGAGMIICEVQQNSDLTYRLYDFDRVDASGNSRELHIEKGLAVLDFADRRGGKTAPVVLPSSDEVKKSLVAACPYFAAERWDVSGPHHAKSDFSRFELLIILSGSGEFQWYGGTRHYRLGECWFIPARLGQFSVLPKESTSLLRTYVPNLSQLRALLARNGVEPSAIERIVFDETHDGQPKTA